MTKKSDYIVRGDDGKLYRVKHSDLHAHPVAETDPAHKHSKKMDELAKKTHASHPMVCIIAQSEDKL